AVALVGGAVVGCCALQVYSKKIAELRSLVVARMARRKGLGTKLIQFCVRKAERKHIHEVMVVTSSPRLFKRSGFGYFSSQKHILFKRFV
ncbi:MAG: GNAT family N-acetyltransferase, partial [bacterium]|nr:GNAT family N-acetyltransferase [bacterium]